MKPLMPLLLCCTIGLAATPVTAGFFNVQTSHDGGETVVRINGQTPRAGDGSSGTANRTTASFKAIELRSAENLVVRIGATPQLKVIGDNNLLDLIDTRVVDGTLIVEARGSYRTHTPIRVEVQLPTLEAVSIEGSADAHVEGLDADQFKVEISGSGNVEASGKAQQVKVELSGSGNALLSALAALVAKVELDGSGNISVNASQQLKAELNGSGNIRYRGAPAKVESEINGSGTIKPQ